MLAHTYRELPEHGRGQAFPIMWRQHGSPCGTMAPAVLEVQEGGFRCCRLPSRPDVAGYLAREVGPGSQPRSSTRQFQDPTGQSRNAHRLWSCSKAATRLSSSTVSMALRLA